MPECSDEHVIVMHDKGFSYGRNNEDLLTFQLGEVFTNVISSNTSWVN